MAKDKTTEALAAAPGSPATGDASSIPASHRLVGIDENAKEVYFPETSRSYVLAEMTACQLELLHRLGSPHVEPIPA